jgi:signal transduction histidine kinase
MGQGLPTQVLRLVEDDYGYFWIASYRGIFRIQKQDLEKMAEPGPHSFIPSYEHWGPEDGLRIGFSNPPNQSVIWKARDGTLWFATKDGIVAEKPADLRVTFSTPEPLVESVVADGESVATDSLGPEARRVEFAFTAPTSHSPEQLEFRYRLDGFDHDWHDGPRQRSASFTNLPRGRYLFRVSVKRAGGSWNPNEARFAFQILPHWYETTTFRILCGLATVLVLWSIHAFRLRQTRRGLSLVMAERSRVAQELHDTLLQSVSGTAMEIQGGLRQISLGSSQLGVEQLSKALDHLGKSMGDARQAIWDLKSPESSALTIIGAMETAARLCVGGPELTVTTSGAPKELSQSIEKQAYRIAVEAVTNAVRHSGCSDVIINVEYGDKSIVLAVADNGCGFDYPSAQSASISNHWGLAGMQQRAEACGGTLRVQTTRGKGTRIVFEAPLGETVRSE